MSTYKTVGRVLDARTRAALPNLRVEAWDRNTGALHSTTATDAEGLFRFLFETSGPDRSSTDSLDRTTTDGGGKTTTDSSETPPFIGNGADAAASFSMAALADFADSGGIVAETPPPVVAFKIFDRDRLLKETADAAYQPKPVGGVFVDDRDLAVNLEVAFSAEPPPPPEPTSVAVQPQGVGPFEPGQPFTARWQTTGPVSFHAVRLAYDGGAFRDLTATDLGAGVNSFTFPVPEPPAPQSQAVVQVIAKDAARAQVAKGEGTPFTVRRPQQQPPTTTNPAPALGAAEVAIHELGESLAASVAGVQGELARYNTALGTYVLDEIDLSIPVLLRVSGLGQIMATVTEAPKPDAAVGQIRLRLRPVAPATEDAVPPAPYASKQPLDALLVLTREAIARLHAERIFSVGDLLRVASTAIGRAALARELFGTQLSAVIDRAVMLSLPLPPTVAAALLKLGLTQPAQLLGTDPAQLADTLTRDAALPVTPADIRQWQQASLLYLDTLTFYRPAS